MGNWLSDTSKYAMGEYEAQYKYNVKSNHRTEYPTDKYIVLAQITRDQYIARLWHLFFDCTLISSLRSHVVTVFTRYLRNSFTPAFLHRKLVFLRPCLQKGLEFHYQRKLGAYTCYPLHQYTALSQFLFFY